MPCLGSRVGLRASATSRKASYLLWMLLTVDEHRFGAYDRICRCARTADWCRTGLCHLCYRYGSNGLSSFRIHTMGNHKGYRPAVISGIVRNPVITLLFLALLFFTAETAVKVSSWTLSGHLIALIGFVATIIFAMLDSLRIRVLILIIGFVANLITWLDSTN